LNTSDIPERHQEFFRRQLLYSLDEKGNCFVHAGFDPQAALEGQRPEIFYRDRELWQAALVCDRSRLATKEMVESVFIGHTSTTSWKTDQPMRAAKVWNLDTGAGNIGRLTIMDVETKEYWQSDLMGELYDQY